jgi:hypothetical protein
MYSAVGPLSDRIGPCKHIKHIIAISHDILSKKKNVFLLNMAQVVVVMEGVTKGRTEELNCET